MTTNSNDYWCGYIRCDWEIIMAHWKELLRRIFKVRLGSNLVLSNIYSAVLMSIWICHVGRVVVWYKPTFDGYKTDIRHSTTHLVLNDGCSLGFIRSYHIPSHCTRGFNAFIYSQSCSKWLPRRYPCTWHSRIYQCHSRLEFKLQRASRTSITAYLRQWCVACGKYLPVCYDALFDQMITGRWNGFINPPSTLLFVPEVWQIHNQMV